MNIKLNNTIYSDEEILEISEKINGEYEAIFDRNNTSLNDILNLASSLSSLNIAEDEKRVMALEYAARIKYEVLLYTDYSNYNVRKDPRYFEYKNNEFAVNKAIQDIISNENECIEDVPKLIKLCVGNAYYSVYGEYYGDEKKLTLDNK